MRAAKNLADGVTRDDDRLLSEPTRVISDPLSFGLPVPIDLRGPLQSSGLSCSMPFELFGPLASYLRLSSTHADSLDLSRRELDLM